MLTTASPTYTSLFTTYLRPMRGKAVMLALLILGSIALQLVSPQILRTFIDGALAGSERGVLLRAAVLFLLAGLGNQLLSVGATYLGADVGWSTTNRLREDLARHCLSLDMAFHNERTPGEMIERIDGDVTALSNFFSQFVVRLLGSALLLIGTLVLLFREDWRVGLVLTLFAVGAALVMGRIRDIAVPASTREREVTAAFFGFLEERLAGLDDLRANGGGAYAMRRYYQRFYDLFHTSRRAWMVRSILWMSIFGIFGIGDVLAFGLGIWLFRAGAITVGTVYLFFQYANMLRTPLEQITQQMQELQKAGAGVERIRELMTTDQAIVDGAGDALSDGPLAVAFEGVTFGYGDNAPTLHDMSFTLAPGTVVGLLGRTGSGKSSLTRLLFRLYEPRQGTVRLGGVNLRDTTLAELRQRVAMVTQEVQLFHASVRDNLTFFDATIPDERILSVLDDLGLGDWLARQPDGLATILATGGTDLSAGEAQLLAFARAFLQDPGLVILDEPSSRLDPATERLLERAVERLLAGRTAIIIAHRLGTVERADEIMVLDAGHLVEHGPYATLAADSSSRFAQLLRAGLMVEGE